MKHLFIVFLATLCWGACKNTPEPKPGDMSQADQPVADLDTNTIKEKAKESGVEVSESDIVGLSKSAINGSNVSMRSGPTIKSEKSGTFEDKEPVEVLGYQNVQNEGEAILSKSITVKGSGGTVKLNQGKAVVVEGFNTETNTYMVSYEDPKKGKLNAEIEASAAQTIIYATWYNVRRKNGEIGWVLGKYLNNN